MNTRGARYLGISPTPKTRSLYIHFFILKIIQVMNKHDLT